MTAPLHLAFCATTDAGSPEVADPLRMFVSGHECRVFVHPAHPLHTQDLMTQPDAATIPVYIVEDDAQMREGLQWMIDASPGFVCAGTYGTCEDAVAAWTRMPPLDRAVILMDIGLPGMSGIACAGHVAAHWPRVRILMLTMFEDADSILQSVRAGATGYLLKNTPPSELLQAIRDVHAGGSPLSAPVARFVLRELKTAHTSPCREYDLTNREMDILHGLVDGLTYKGLAQRLEISVDTVRSHIKKLYEKLGVHSRNEAVAVALRHGIRPRPIS